MPARAGCRSRRKRAGQVLPGMCNGWQDAELRGLPLQNSRYFRSRRYSPYHMLIEGMGCEPRAETTTFVCFFPLGCSLPQGSPRRTMPGSHSVAKEGRAPRMRSLQATLRYPWPTLVNTLPLRHPGRPMYPGPENIALSGGISGRINEPAQPILVVAHLVGG